MHKLLSTFVLSKSDFCIVHSYSSYLLNFVDLHWHLFNINKLNLKNSLMYLSNIDNPLVLYNIASKFPKYNLTLCKISC